MTEGSGASAAGPPVSDEDVAYQHEPASANAAAVIVGSAFAAAPHWWDVSSQLRAKAAATGLDPDVNGARISRVADSAEGNCAEIDRGRRVISHGVQDGTGADQARSEADIGCGQVDKHELGAYFAPQEGNPVGIAAQGDVRAADDQDGGRRWLRDAQGFADLREGMADRIVGVNRSAEDGGIGIEGPSAWRQVDYIASQDDERERMPSPG